MFFCMFVCLSSAWLGGWLGGWGGCVNGFLATLFIDRRTQPSKVDPLAEDDDYNYEIYSKLWDEDTKATLARRGAAAAAMWAAEHE